MSARTILKHVYNNGGMTFEQYQKIDRNLKERPHGEWKEHDDYCECSECQHREDNDRFIWNDMNFCSKCGADMRKEGDTNDQL